MWCCLGLELCCEREALFTFIVREEVCVLSGAAMIARGAGKGTYIRPKVVQL
jgi:hypothetical protein